MDDIPTLVADIEYALNNEFYEDVQIVDKNKLVVLNLEYEAYTITVERAWGYLRGLQRKG
jgi:hypothetical protein